MDIKDKSEGKNTHEIYDSQDMLIAEGVLDYVGSKISVFTVYGIFHKEKMRGAVRIESKLIYEEVYSAKVEGIEGNRVMLDSLRNISSDLRQDLKVEYRGKIKIIYTEADNKGQKLRSTADAQMENLSGGGVGFVADKVFEVGQELHMKTLLPDLFFEVPIKVLRRESFGRLYRYGCKFNNISRVEESSVRKVVYKLQIDNRNYLKAKEGKFD